MKPSSALWGFGFLAVIALLAVPLLDLPVLDGTTDGEPDVSGEADAHGDTDAPIDEDRTHGAGDESTDIDDIDDEGGPAEGAPEASEPEGTRAKEREVFTGDSAGTVRALEITEEMADASKPWKEFDGNPPKVFDIDGDGKKEIIVQNDNHWVYVFDSKSGAMLAELEATPLPDVWGARTFNGPEAAVLKRGGEAHIVTANSAAGIAAYRFDASNSTEDAFAFEKAWDVRLDECHEDPGMDAKVVLADLTLDGNLEILAATEEEGLYALDHEGAVLWQNCLAGGNAAPIVADVTADGWPDVVHASDGGIVALLSGRTGAWIWSYQVRDHYEVSSGAIPVRPAVGQLSGGPGLEIVIGARDSHDPDDWDNNSALLLALDSRGKVLWDFQDPVGNPLTYTRPIIADADDDGENEVYWADWNTVGHKPPSPSSDEAWNRTGPANFYRIDADGDMVWRTTLETFWNNKDLAIADMTGDGTAEILANGPDHDGKDGIWYLDVRDGSKEAWVDLDPWKAQRGPIIEDLWGTGTAQWVIEVASNSPGTGPAVLVYDVRVPFEPVWPHVAYPDPDAAFDAAFHEVRGSNWWVEVQVQGKGARVAAVEMRIDDGAWQPMETEGWGWSASAPVPDGSRIQFRASSPAGDGVVSGCYEWPAAHEVPCRGRGQEAVSQKDG